MTQFYKTLMSQRGLIYDVTTIEKSKTKYFSQNLYLAENIFDFRRKSYFQNKIEYQDTILSKKICKPG